MRHIPYAVSTLDEQIKKRMQRETRLRFGDSRVVLARDERRGSERGKPEELGIYMFLLINR